MLGLTIHLSSKVKISATQTDENPAFSLFLCLIIWFLERAIFSYYCQSVISVGIVCRVRNWRERVDQDRIASFGMMSILIIAKASVSQRNLWAMCVYECMHVCVSVCVRVCVRLKCILRIIIGQRLKLCVCVFVCLHIYKCVAYGRSAIAHCIS